MATSIFERATKKKLRFESPMGMLTVEDVWDLPLTTRNANKASLDDLAKKINRKIKENDEESFVVKKTAANSDMNLRMDIVKHIIDVRMAEAEAAEKTRKDKVREQKILEILAHKEHEDLENMSKEELEALLKKQS